MDTFYSASLLVALTCGGLGFAGTLWAVWALAGGRSPSSWLRPLCWIGGAVCLVAGILSVGVHRAFGHGPGSPEPMAAGTFFLAHRAYWVAAMLAAGSLVGGWLIARRGRGRTAEG